METTQASEMVLGVSAILLISPDAAGLAGFYRAVLGVPLEDEIHEGVPLHYACDLAGVHFAIHPADGWPGVNHSDARSPVVALAISDAAVRDPDGNHVELLQAAA